MSPRKRYSFFFDDSLGEGLKALKARDGITEAEAVRRAVAEFLARKSVKVKRTPATKRKRS